MDALFKELSELKVYNFSFDFKPYFSGQKTVTVTCEQSISNDAGGKVVRGYMSLHYDIRRNSLQECLEEIKLLAQNAKNFLDNSPSKS